MVIARREREKYLFVPVCCDLILHHSFEASLLAFSRFLVLRKGEREGAVLDNRLSRLFTRAV